MRSAPYVALGDSVAAGIGSQTPGSHVRRGGGYPLAVSRALGLDLAYQASRGSTVEDVLDWQVDAIGADTRLVTLTVGAYDAGTLDPSRPDGPTAVPDGLPARLATLIAHIRDRSPRVRILVTGYPHPPTGRLRVDIPTVDALVDLVLEVASGQGATPVDVRDAFAGRAELQHGLTIPLENSLLPTAAGHDVLARCVVDAVGADRALAERSVHRWGMAIPAAHPGPDRVGSGRLISAPLLLRAARYRR